MEERRRHVVDERVGARREASASSAAISSIVARRLREERVVHEEREALARERHAVTRAVERHGAHGGRVVAGDVLVGERVADGGDEPVAPVDAEPLVRLDEEVGAVGVRE